MPTFWDLGPGLPSFQAPNNTENRDGLSILLLKQCAAVTTQRLVSREPAQWWEPFLRMLTIQGHWASMLSSPPTIRFSC